MECKQFLLSIVVLLLFVSSAATQESDIKMSCSSEKLELGETAECEITKFPSDFNKDGDYDFKWIPAPSKIEDRSLDSIKFKAPEDTQSPLLTVKYELEAGTTYSETTEISLENSGNGGGGEVPVVPGNSNDESSGNLNDSKPKAKNSGDAVVDEKTRNQSKLTETKAEQSENQEPSENQIKMSKNRSNKTDETQNSVKESDKSIEELLGGEGDRNSGNNLENTSEEVKSSNNEVQDPKINNNNNNDQKVRSLEQKIQEQKETIKKLRQRVEELKKRSSGKEKEEDSSSLPDKDDSQEKNGAPIDSSNTERELNTRDNEDFGISSNGSLNQRDSSTGESILSSIKSILS